MIWEVPQPQDRDLVFILAGGPSLAKFDPAMLARFGKRTVITINDSWRLCPVGSFNYFCDSAWWTDQIARCLWDTKMQRSFHDQIYRGFWVTSHPSFREHPQVHQMQLTGERGLETNRNGLRHGSNSGFQAINLAYHLGAKRIVLLGYDMKCAGTRTHWHDATRASAAAFALTIEKSFLPHFESLVKPLEEAGVEVINATPGSALMCWKHIPLDEL